MTIASNEVPAPPTGTAPGRIAEGGKPDAPAGHVPASALKPVAPGTPALTVPPTAPAKPKPKKKAKKAAPKPVKKAAPAKALDPAKLAKTPITALRSMVRARQLVSGTEVIRLTKDKAIALLLGKGETGASSNNATLEKVQQGLVQKDLSGQNYAAFAPSRLVISGSRERIDAAIRLLTSHPDFQQNVSQTTELYL